MSKKIGKIVFLFLSTIFLISLASAISLSDYLGKIIEAKANGGLQAARPLYLSKETCAEYKCDPEIVKAYQEILNANRPTNEKPIVVDGVFGNDTERLTYAVQEKLGVNSDGIVGANTAQALQKVTPQEVVDYVPAQAQAKVLSGSDTYRTGNWAGTEATQQAAETAANQAYLKAYDILSKDPTITSDEVQSRALEVGRAAASEVTTRINSGQNPDNAIRDTLESDNSTTNQGTTRSIGQSGDQTGSQDTGSFFTDTQKETLGTLVARPIDQDISYWNTQINKLEADKQTAQNDVRKISEEAYNCSISVWGFGCSSGQEYDKQVADKRAAVDDIQSQIDYIQGKQQLAPDLDSLRSKVASGDFSDLLPDTQAELVPKLSAILSLQEQIDSNQAKVNDQNINWFTRGGIAAELDQQKSQMRKLQDEVDDLLMDKEVGRAKGDQQSGDLDKAALYEQEYDKVYGENGDKNAKANDEKVLEKTREILSKDPKTKAEIDKFIKEKNAQQDAAQDDACASDPNSSTCTGK